MVSKTLRPLYKDVCPAEDKPVGSVARADAPQCILDIDALHTRRSYTDREQVIPTLAEKVARRIRRRGARDQLLAPAIWSRDADRHLAEDRVTERAGHLGGRIHPNRLSLRLRLPT